MSQRQDNPQPAATAADSDVYRQRLTVSFDYPVHFARGVFAPGNPLLVDVLDRLAEHRVHRVMVCVDAGLAAAQGDLVGRITEYFHTHAARAELAGAVQIVPGGEKAKNGWDAVRNIMWTLGNLHLDRQSFVLAVGGGAMLDMVGFAASLVHRGLRLVRMPSTTLAQNDGGVGVKTGMDEHGQKNFVGTFAPPFAVINDLDLLKTLSQRDWIGGAAEAFKVAAIKDVAFFDWLCDNADALVARDAGAMEYLIRRCATLHLEHIRTAGDPFELGSARPLDFGHWAAHKIETLTGYTVGHGQAVAIGMAVDAHCAMQQGLLRADQFDRFADAMRQCGLELWHACLDRRTAEGEREILAGLRDFREHLGGALTITLPDGLGHAVEVHHVDAAAVEAAIVALKRRGA